MKKMKKTLALLLALTLSLSLISMSALAATKYNKVGPDATYDESTTYYTTTDGTTYTRADNVSSANFGDIKDTLYTSAETVSITVTRDTSTYEGDASADSRDFSWYRVFTATYEANTSTGGDDSNGLPGDVTASASAAAYTASSTVAGKLGTWNSETRTWTKAVGNLWFDLTPIAGTTNYSVKWVGADTTSATAQAAAKWLKDNAVYDANGTLEFSGSGSTAAWSADGLEKGYYLLVSEAGNNLIAATTDINVTEKNNYPPLDKTQADEDTTTQSDADRPVAVGDVLTYEVKVTIPKTAKVGEKILVWDKAYTGLTYNNDVAVKSGSNTGNATIGEVPEANQVANATWQKLITITTDSLGTDVVFTFTMTVNSSALTSTDKKNESGLKYGTGSGTNPFPYESTPDKVEYKTYFAGIKKVDADTNDALDNVEFTLKEGSTEFKVKLVDGVYIPSTESDASATVKTDTNGFIKIRGLDSDKTYTLTETKNPHDGYNMLAAPVTLTLHEDTLTTLEYTPASEFNSEETYYTKSGDDYVVASDVTAENFVVGTYYTKTESTSSSFTGAADTDWTTVTNEKGAVLPSTGGIGTKIFYALGAVLVVGAGVVLVSRKRVTE